MNTEKILHLHFPSSFLRFFLALFVICALTLLGENAQTDVVDPSIFDGSDKDTEKSEPSPEPPPNQTPPNEETDETEGAAASASEEVPPREIKLPDSPLQETEAEKERGAPEDEVENPPGVPAGSGSGESRAGDRIESTEKIPPGQAVDFPWDM